QIPNNISRLAQSSVSQAWPKPGTLAQTRRLPLPFRPALPPIESHAELVRSSTATALRAQRLSAVDAERGFLGRDVALALRHIGLGQWRPREAFAFDRPPHHDEKDHQACQEPADQLIRRLEAHEDEDSAAEHGEHGNRLGEPTQLERSLLGPALTLG